MNNLSIKALMLGAAMAVSGWNGVLHAQTTEQLPLLVAAGSLKTAMDETIAAYQAQGGSAFKAKYGPSGKLRKEIEAGAKVDVFASADIEHTNALAQQKLLDVSSVFTHNDLCVVARPELKLHADNMLDVLRSPSVRVATSTPVSDPMGDYTWQFFRNAEGRQPGIYQLLDAKALKLSGASVPAPGEKLPYITAFEDDKADVYIMYCTNAVITKKAVPQLHVVRIPDELNVRSVYGIAAGLHSAAGKDFVRFVMESTGQAILKKHGFE
ncbi:molybdate ABC transporter substrate-binding protein [Herminiimonas sp. NPDC097707]|uniref:molybdate ABC transporter substrate-binding protein n=1 Tax=Herminiimonas sp. NPDC097707 TaxID=3364007 RepID=UPI00383A28B7